jgi:hypothetical protein
MRSRLGWAFFALAASLAGCGGGNAPTTSATVTVPDLAVYLAQSRCPGGSPPTNCAAPVTQKASDPMLWRLSDGSAGSQEEYGDTVLADGAAYFIHTWSYPPHGRFVAAKGDGGEIYLSDGTTARICCTQDGSRNAIQRFADWWLFDNRTPNCSDGWRTVDQWSRACRATVTYPARGFGLTQIVADTIVSEHYSRRGYSGNMERFYLAADWGNLCWEAYSAATPADATASEPAAFGAPASPINTPLVSRRMRTNLIATDGSLSVDAYGWPPAGFAP